MAQLISLAFIGLFLGAVAIQVLTYRRERAVKPRRIVIGQTAAFLSMAFFSAITARPPGPIAWFFLLSFGLVAGVGYGTLVSVRRGAGGVTMSYTLPWLIVWATLMALTQLTAVVFRSVPVFIYGLAIINLGMNMGMNARVLMGYRAAYAVTGVMLVLCTALVLPAGSFADEENVGTLGGSLTTEPIGGVNPQQPYDYGMKVPYPIFPDDITIPDELYPPDPGPAPDAPVAPPETQDPYANDPYANPGATPPLVPETGPAPPLPPAQTSAAIGLSSLILAIGAILQVSDKLDPDSLIEALSALGRPAPDAPGALGQPGATAAPDPLADLPRTADGRVLVNAPWDEAGQAWVSAEDARHTLDMQAKGYTWDKRWGWVQGGEAATRQAATDAGRAAWLATDPELTRITRQIQAARDQAAYHHRMAETYDQRQALRDRIDAQQAETDRLMEDVATAETQYRRVAAIGMIADVCVGVAADATLVLPVPGAAVVGQTIRGLYNVGKGIGTAVGENLVGITETDPLTGAVTTRHRFEASDLARGVAYGTKNYAADLLFEAGVKKLLRMPQLWESLAEAPRTLPVPADLLSPNAAARQLLEGVDSAVAEKGLTQAVKEMDPETVHKLFKHVGRDDLARLESLGHISRNEAAAVNQIMKETVNEAVEGGVRNAVRDWSSRGSGVRLERVVIGDSGSSAGSLAGKAKSVLMDNDRTVVAVFNQDDLARFASENGLTKTEAYERLSAELTESVGAKTAEKLPGKWSPGGQLTAAEADLKYYNGLGSGAGQADSYAKGITETRSAVQGTGTVFTESGDVYRTSGQAVVDEARLATHNTGAATSFADPAFPVSEFSSVAEQQVKALAHKSDPKSVAKALGRLADMTRRSEVARAGVVADPDLARLAERILKAPQGGTASMLRNSGFTEEQFAAAIRAEGDRLAEQITRVTAR